MLQRFLAVLISSSLLLTSCSGRNTPVASLNIDLYLHPESARGDDLLLQSAIETELLANDLTRSGLIHTRVINGIVFLSGAVQNSEVRIKAEEIAGQTVVSVNGRTVKTAEKVRNQLELAP